MSAPLPAELSPGLQGLVSSFFFSGSLFDADTEGRLPCYPPSRFLRSSRLKLQLLPVLLRPFQDVAAASWYIRHWHKVGLWDLPRDPSIGAELSCVRRCRVAPVDAILAPLRLHRIVLRLQVLTSLLYVLIFQAN